MRKITISFMLSLVAGILTAGAETVDVTYTYTLDGEQIGSRTVTETVGSSPTDPSAIPSYVTASGYPSVIESGTSAYTIATTYNCVLPFAVSTAEQESWFFVYFNVTGSGTYYWYAGDTQGKEKTTLDACSVGDQGDYKWKFEGNWLDGFTIGSQGGKYLQASTLPDTPGSNAFTSTTVGFTTTKSEASSFLPDKNGTNWRWKLVRSASSETTQDVYLAHTSSSSLTLSLFSTTRTQDFTNSVYAYGGSNAFFIAASKDIRDDFNSLLETIKLIAAGTPPVGYPEVDETTASQMNTLAQSMTVSESSTLSGLNSFRSQVFSDALLNSTDIQLPQEGHVYVFTNKHVSAGRHYLYHDTESGKLLYGERGSCATDELPDCAKFVCHVVDDHFLFANIVTGDYLIWRGGSTTEANHGAGHNANQGSLSDYDATFCSLFMSKCVKTTSNMGSAASNADLLGCVNFGGRRPQTGSMTDNYEECFLYTTHANGYENFIQDSGSSITPRYDTDHSSVFLVEEVTDYDRNSVTLKQASDSKYYSTLWLPYPTNIPDGYKAYTAEPGDDEAGVFYLTELTGAIPAKTGVVLYGDAEPSPALFSPAGQSTASVTEKGALTGSNEAVTATGSEYALSGASSREIGFYPVGSGVTIPAGRAYYAATVAETASVRGYTFRFDGEATGIAPVEARTGSRNAEVYDLQGRRVARPVRGLYVVDGKKVFIK